VRTQILTPNNWPKIISMTDTPHNWPEIIFMTSQFLFQESADGLSEIITNSPLGNR